VFLKKVSGFVHDCSILYHLGELQQGAESCDHTSNASRLYNNGKAVLLPLTAGVPKEFGVSVAVTSC
jgi:hypothetical protein